MSKFKEIAEISDRIHRNTNKAESLNDVIAGYHGKTTITIKHARGSMDIIGTPAMIQAIQNDIMAEIDADNAKLKKLVDEIYGGTPSGQPEITI